MENRTIKKILTKSLLILFINTRLLAQTPAIQWQKSFGGTGYEIATDILQTLDSGYIVGAVSNSNDGDITGAHGNQDVWILKTNSLGVTQWQKSYGGSGIDNISSIQTTSDGGYIFAGATNSTDGDVSANYGSEDCWVVKLDAAGNIQWQKNYGGSLNDGISSIKQTASGDYIFIGYTTSNDSDVSGNNSITSLADFWVVKLSASGNIIWQKCLGGTDDDNAYDIIETSDGNFIVVGETWSSNGDVIGKHNPQTANADVWVVKLNTSGNIIWQKALGGSYSDRARAVVEANNGNYIIGAYAQSHDSDVVDNHGTGAYSDFWILALDTAGTIQWQKCLGGSGDDYLAALQKTSDGGYIIAGQTSSSDGDVTGLHGAGFDYWIIKTDAIGTLQWQKTLGGNNNEEAHTLKTTIDGGYIVAGKSNSNDGDVTGNHGDDDCWIVKLTGNTMGLNNATTQNSYCIYPNPASNYITISGIKNNTNIYLLDITGNIVYTKQHVETTQNINIEHLKNGIYILKIINGDKPYTRKIIVNK